MFANLEQTRADIQTAQNLFGQLFREIQSGAIQADNETDIYYLGKIGKLAAELLREIRDFSG